MTQQPPVPDPYLAIDDSRVTMVAPEGPRPKPNNTKRVLLIVGLVLGVILVVGGVVVAILLFAVQGALEQAHRAQCAANLRQIGIGCQAWAASGKRQWPTAFTKESTAWDQIGDTRFSSDATDRTDEPVNSNTASLWALAKAGLVDNPAVFVCPSTDHQPDVSIGDIPTSPCRDFQSAANISYSYQNTFQGNGGGYVLTAAAPPGLVIAADANPQRGDMRGRSLEYLSGHPSYEVPGWGQIDGVWDLNSPNHNFKGQNILCLDGHVEWVSNPFAGEKYDNIWTAQIGNLASDPSNTPRPDKAPDSSNISILQAYTNTKSYDGKSALKAGVQADSVLVP